MEERRSNKIFEAIDLTILGIPEFKIATKREEILKHLKVGVTTEGIPYRVFARKRTHQLDDDRVYVYVETPKDHEGEETGEFALSMTDEHIKGLWRLIDKSRKRTNGEYKKLVEKYKKVNN